MRMHMGRQERLALETVQDASQDDNVRLCTHQGCDRITPVHLNISTHIHEHVHTCMIHDVLESSQFMENDGTLKSANQTEYRS